MPEPTFTYTPEDFQYAIARLKACGDFSMLRPSGETLHGLIKLLTFAQGLAPQIPMLKQLLAESRERNESLTRALAAKTQELEEAQQECQTAEAACADLMEGHARLTQQFETAQFVPGLWVCPTCGFTVQKNFLHAADMSVSVDTRDVQDICPNDGASLRRQTRDAHEQEARSIAIAAMERERTASDRAEAAEQQLAAVRAYFNEGRDHYASPAQTIKREVLALLGDGPGPALAPQAQLIEDVLAIIASEEELDGPMPAHMREAFMADPAETMRSAGRSTKTCIANRIRAHFQTVLQPAAGGAASPAPKE